MPNLPEPVPTKYNAVPDLFGTGEVRAWEIVGDTVYGTGLPTVGFCGFQSCIGGRWSGRSENAFGLRVSFNPPMTVRDRNLIGTLTVSFDG